MSPSSPSRSDLDKRWKSALALYHGEDDVNKDEDLAFKNFYELANKGHEPSMLELGCMYFMGSGVEKSFVQAKHWWKKLADLSNDPEAFYGLGLIFHLGREEEGLKPMPNKALKAWRKAAAGSNFNAIHCLETYYPNWNPGNKTPTSKSFYDPDVATPTSPGGQHTHFISSGTPASPMRKYNGGPLSPAGDPSMNSLTVGDSLSRRRSSLVHELGFRSNTTLPIVRKKKNVVTLKVPPSGLPNKDDAPQMSPSTKELIKESSVNVNHLTKSLSYMKNQLYDIQATVNVLNSQFVKDTSNIQESVSTLRTDVRDLSTKLGASTRGGSGSSPVQSGRSSDSREVEHLTDRVDSLEKKMKRSMEKQDEMMHMMQDMMTILKRGTQEPSLTMPSLSKIPSKLTKNDSSSSMDSAKRLKMRK
mmetsp:Transcript_1670/g.5828  ORF Transcript_1670/g.5828 Transcript_1670/m.5828 type:complete len:417 (-) Transcript_1670:1422-2672(-)|eukprot:CAMPEP_0117453292 /NCGR_PEP_ID=MMETSP0759-20121206/10133_1 /TAXON_ID=63605 /ORGANISM="Percolomonas cosmopolitus, Strain WS" /LENGTH=416 /DNA_ID=CAMNT_0005246289 /DNA_START=843 /DNA_END=2093 /DNA_ORIENTATION=+